MDHWASRSGGCPLCSVLLCRDGVRWGQIGQRGPCVSTKAWVFTQFPTDAQTVASIHGNPNGWRLKEPTDFPNIALSPTYYCQWHPAQLSPGLSVFETFWKVCQATAAPALISLFLVSLEFFSFTQEHQTQGGQGRSAQLCRGLSGDPAWSQPLLPQLRGEALSLKGQLHPTFRPATLMWPRPAPRWLDCTG